MKPNRALWAVLTFLVLVAGSSLLLEGQSPEPPSAKSRQAVGKLPAAVEILSRYTRAVGGERAIRRYRSRRAVGRFELRAQGISGPIDRKSTRLNSSHLVISYAVFCLKKKTKAH